jgi:uncharacterized protein YndB with AHSA1/START domain
MTSIRRSIHVARPVDVAFKVFTEEMSSWWPLHDGFAYAGDKAKDIIVEGLEGGRFYERATDGQEFDIGTVSVWDPPSRVVVTWSQNNWDAPTEVEVAFVPDGDGTRVELEHRGWDKVGVTGTEGEAGWADGWDFVLSKYSDAVGRP